MNEAIAKLNAVPAAKIWKKRLGITHVYQAAEMNGRWYGVTEAQLADLQGRLKRNEANAYSLWCAETSAPVVPYLATDLDGGDEETFEVRNMYEAIDCARAWVNKHHEETGDTTTRLLIIGPDGDEERLTHGA